MAQVTQMYMEKFSWCIKYNIQKNLMKQMNEISNILPQPQ